MIAAYLVVSLGVVCALAYAMLRKPDNWVPIVTVVLSDDQARFLEASSRVDHTIIADNVVLSSASTFKLTRTKRGCFLTITRAYVAHRGT